MALNIDVIRDVLSFCSTASLLHASLTCHNLRDEAAKELISRPVHLKNHAEAKSFYLLMLSDSHRPRVLRTLTLEHSPHRLTEHDPLLDLIQHATHLHDLKLRWCDAYFVSSETGFASAICNLEHLFHLQNWAMNHEHNAAIARDDPWTTVLSEDS
ncbi:hypothetical protein C8Q74DRAFT_1372545 [Fomes fomentarius]|nr:hypothetical protein C8Q74DRAFT_1372545 [Fomes fomentarius]